MSHLCFYFQAHQARHLKSHPGVAAPFDDAADKRRLANATQRSYLPANHLISSLVRDNADFRVCFAVSGTLLELARRFQPALMKSFERLGNLARETGRIEILCEPYYHSLAGLFQDTGKEEFKDQLRLHKKAVETVFGVVPTTVRNAELFYNNSIAVAAADTAFGAILCERREDMMRSGSPNSVYVDKQRRIKVLPRNPGLSDELISRFPQRQFTADEFAAWIARVDGEMVLVGIDCETIGERQWTEKGGYAFWRYLPQALRQHQNVVVRTATEMAQVFEDPPVTDVGDLSTSSWARPGRNTDPWLGNVAQQELFLRYQQIESKVKASGDTSLLEMWRHLGATDHFLQMRTGVHWSIPACTGGRSDRHPEPTEAVMRYTGVLTALEMELSVKHRRARTRRKARRPRILLITPEVTELPPGFGNLANYVRAKGGGLADISAALVGEMLRLGLDIHIAMPKYERQMVEYAQISLDKLDQITSLFRSSEQIHLAQDSSFSHVRHVYERAGTNTALHRAIAFQRTVVNQIFDEAMPDHGKMMVHCNDWMTGLIPAAAKARGLPSVFTVHNIHTAWETLAYIERCGIDVSRFWRDLHLTAPFGDALREWDQTRVDFLLSGIKAAGHVNTVSPSFLLEVVNGYFSDRIAPAVRHELTCKYQEGLASGILNAPRHGSDPRIAQGLACNYDIDQVMPGKRDNKMEFQKRLGLRPDPEAPLFFWPHRLYEQKGPRLLEQIAWSLLNVYAEDGLQVAVIGNGDDQWEQAFAVISLGSGGRMCFRNFDAQLSELGKAAADFILMPSLYEPCGLPQMEGMRYGTLPIVRATGGLKDTVHHLDVERGRGNGFVFSDYVPDALWWACTEAMRFHRLPAEQRRTVLQRVMRESREQFNLEVTTLEYVRIYEQLLGEKVT